MKKYIKLYLCNLLFIGLNLGLNFAYSLTQNQNLFAHIVWILTVQSSWNMVLFDLLYEW